MPIKKNDIVYAKAQRLIYPSTCIAEIEAGGGMVEVKGALPEQVLKIRIQKSRSSLKKGRILAVEHRAPYENDSFCGHFGNCGGCQRQTLSYEDQLQVKQMAVQALIDQAGLNISIESIQGSPLLYAYRNKMEYSFGDEEKGGTLNLGMHRKGRSFDVIGVPECQLTHKDFEIIRAAAQTYARNSGIPKFNGRSGTGLWRNLVIRRGHYSGEILVGISVSSAHGFDEHAFAQLLLSLDLEGKIVGIIKLINDEPSDAVKQGDKDKLIYGRDYYTDSLLGLGFEVSFFSFFQTNILAAEKLFESAFEKLPSLNKMRVFDLFCGVGTIAQLISKKAARVLGVEIVEDAVKKAKKNAKKNSIDNCEFIAGDVFKVLSHNKQLGADAIVLDPPRAGVSPKAVDKIAALGAEYILYISCNPKTMLANLAQFQSLGYNLGNLELHDLYPHTQHVESLVLMRKTKK